MAAVCEIVANPNRGRKPSFNKSDYKIQQRIKEFKELRHQFLNESRMRDSKPVYRKITILKKTGSTFHATGIGEIPANNKVAAVKFISENHPSYTHIKSGVIVQEIKK